MPPVALRTALWFLTILLCGIGLVMVASTTVVMNQAGTALTYKALITQAAAMGLGIGIALMIAHLGTEWLRQRYFIGFVIIATLGVLAVTPHIGVSVKGATRWIDLGIVRVQPAEFAKLSFILILSWYLVRVEERVRVPWNGVLIPMMCFLILAVLVYRTRDLGSVIVLGGLLWFTLLFSGANWLYSTFLGFLATPMVLYLTVFRSSYRFNRIMAFWDPMNTDIEATYHLRQSFIAIGTGGTYGVGLGQGPSKNAFLPERHTDFIYAIICEELGLFGAVTVAGLFLLLVIIGFLIAARTQDRHQRLIAIGATSLIGIQAFWNMLVVVGALPTKGLTLPFISYGGSSILVCLATIGLLDAVARQLPEKKVVRSSSPRRIGGSLVDRPRAVRRPTEGAL